MTPFTEAELLADSANRLVELEASGRRGAAHPRICHHFFPLDGAPEDVYLQALPKALLEIDPDALIDAIGDPVGIELWQLLEPDRERLMAEVRQFHKAATSCVAVYGGWTYEPERSTTNGS